MVAKIALAIAAEHVDDGRAAALVRHVQQVHPRHQLEQLAAQVLEAADAARRILHIARLRLGEFDHFFHRFYRQVRVHQQHVRGRRQDGDRRKAVDRLVGQLVEPRVDRVHQRHDEQRVAVLGRVGGELGADDAARAAAVVDDELLAEPPAQLRGDHAADRVIDGAGGERNDDAHQLGGVVLRRCRRRENHQEVPPS